MGKRTEELLRFLHLVWTRVRKTMSFFYLGDLDFLNRTDLQPNNFELCYCDAATGMPAASMEAQRDSRRRTESQLYAMQTKTPSLPSLMVFCDDVAHI